MGCTSSDVDDGGIKRTANAPTKQGNDLDQYRSLKTVKLLSGGRQSKEVRLLAGKRVVAKCFDPLNRKHVRNFGKEIRNYKAVHGCPFTPRLLAVDSDKLVLYIQYCGKRPKEYTPELKRQVHFMLETLRDKYGLARRFHNRPDNLPRLANLATNNGKLKLIDLGPPFKRVKRPKI